MIEILEKQLVQWKKVLLVFLGAAAALVLIALVDLPTSIVARDSYVTVDGWMGLWFILEIASLTPGLILLLTYPWRQLPLPLRLPVGFGFLAAAWLGMLAFDLRLATRLPIAFHFAVFGLGVLLASLYLLLRHTPQRKEEMFP